MNIPDELIVNSPKEQAAVIRDPHIFRGVLIASRAWGVRSLDDPSVSGAEAIDETMVEFAQKLTDLRAKFEVNGDTLNGDAELEADYYDELGSLMSEYRSQLFASMIDYVCDDVAIGLMIDLLSDD